MIKHGVLAAAVLFAMAGAPYTGYAATPSSTGVAEVISSPAFLKARAHLNADYERVVREMILLTEIPAPPFKEKAKGLAYMEMLKAAGLTDVEMDAEGNVMGLRKGTKPGPMLVVAAHLDTVFPEGTNVKVRREGSRLYAPGIADDTSSLAVLLAFVRALNNAKIETQRDILFVGNVGEEGPGDLRGSRYLFTKGKYKDRIGEFISFESGQGRITTGGVGSKRYKVTYKGPGGHSLRDFGLVNPAYAMADAMVHFGQMPVPAAPRTVYNVGVVEGGTSVNSIPFEVSMEVDMRSDGEKSLKETETRFLKIIEDAAVRENSTRSTAKGAITVEGKLIGDRPVGSTPDDAQIVGTAIEALKIAGVEPTFEDGSTDSNVPMSLGIPAVTLRSGFFAERIHSLDESLLLDQPSTVKFMAIGLSTVLALSGLRGD